MVGIDKINFFTPNTYIDLETLASHRGVDPKKFTIGIGQSKMSVPTITQDTVSMAANAALPILTDDDRATIDLIIVGTETGVDQSKSCAAFVHDLLGIQPFAKAFEIKQACYGATAGLMTAIDYVLTHPGRKALVIGSDISKYGLSSSGEVTQGAGAVAMLISDAPRILEFDLPSVSLTKNIFDFWRPNYSDVAFVDGQFSNEAYINFFTTLWTEFSSRNSLTIEEVDAFCFHLPYTKMGKKALLPLLDTVDDDLKEALLSNYELSTTYSRNIGNIYTGSLYLSLISLLEHATTLIAGDRLVFFSYGSGAVGEMFSGQLVEGFADHLAQAEHAELLDQRISLTVDQYETIFKEELPKDDGHYHFTQEYDNAAIYLSEIKDHQRLYTIRD
ncbi:hydroxymethylglutaryl-CoA synthase [Vagococcus penaei]|uniref:Hydroxymethylglutaryl-CoA synthase n=1 Tax=Vagococcus penaei TaxID=633807 RepID=A0A1Q2D4W3_9ENTE|nr:hydroxymethylglutaryl-CoA synthase [Vagococcus penaei]AQP53440.1 hydroxymethylglutaryl-CoA synthase [Vagococcus penaei]RSU00829.1 hydroxymethylglutaryl-CoA synthase [Vagococcus penaei]